MSFVVSLNNTHKLLQILKSQGSFLNNEKGVWFDFLKHHLILMYPNIPKDNNNFSIGCLKSLQWVFIVFINRFKPRKEVTFIKERSRTIIFNTLPNSLDKRTNLKI